MSRLLLSVVVLASVLAVAGCKREERQLSVSPELAAPAQALRQISVQVGGTSPPSTGELGYEQNAYALSQGQQLYTHFNCVGCHAYGGGDIGPALLDDKWLYGSEALQIYASIVEGRPNGMPSYAMRLTTQQAWQLVAYVRSLSGLASPSAAPGREDDMKGPPPPNSAEKLTPVNLSEPMPR